ncbi:uncharacterized protein LOC122021367 isoform X1 [Zingiber officinale]|uniref:uncharacterized protein LOC122021367 isoform X1 n=1 Tax=Zingiber officinale TaxID=94328 RepID=UPI001C4B35BF|nr:uncharacterized protein LOC122021367 isoform X1 [Zingiber officinale]XP_042435419.1 uncharacterized protein LOC122021367 isoform X1 [Zingiber officinale]XP_042435420.1 uncharacterized protein LOC122021367 isoform X1 [Zingiber officinale]XP_042435421.1 uncharacterized protein LOC122021367 isoform X1 [Zingiber officinale]
MGKKRSSSLRPVKASKGDPQSDRVSSNCYEGERLDHLLVQLTKSIESAKLSKGELPDKMWIKQQFAIGVNDVTRVLERMIQAEADCQSKKEHSNINLRRAPLVPLQAVLLAADCNPRRLTKHIPSLASPMQIPVIFVKDNKRGSLRLGELVMLKTAMAIGIKVKGSIINEAIDELLSSQPPEISLQTHD